jgi:hypothetical protein
MEESMPEILYLFDDTLIRLDWVLWIQIDLNPDYDGEWRIVVRLKENVDPEQDLVWGFEEKQERAQEAAKLTRAWERWLKWKFERKERR